MNLKAINDPGTRPSRHGGVVLQQRRRSQQLESIADEITAAMTDNVVKEVDGSPVMLGKQTAHRIKGYMEQLRIIAAELKAAGK